MIDVNHTQLLVLSFPVVLDLGIVVGNAALILRVIKSIGEVHQESWINTDHLITMCDPGRDQ